MQKYLIYLSIFLVPVLWHPILGQNKIKWMSWEEALEKSKKTKRKIFVDIYTDWCGWCKKMDKSHLQIMILQNISMKTIIL